MHGAWWGILSPITCNIIAICSYSCTILYSLFMTVIKSRFYKVQRVSGCNVQQRKALPWYSEPEIQSFSRMISNWRGSNARVRGRSSAIWRDLLLHKVLVLNLVKPGCFTNCLAFFQKVYSFFHYYRFACCVPRTKHNLSKLTNSCHHLWITSAACLLIIWPASSSQISIIITGNLINWRNLWLA